MITHILAGLRRVRTRLILAGKSRYLSYGRDPHIGTGTRLWAPNELRIGNCVYIGKEVNIEADCIIGNYALIANRVAIVGRHDHDFRAIGYPVRFAPWIGSKIRRDGPAQSPAVIGDDVWIGYGAVIMTGVQIGRGAIVGAGSVVTKDVDPYSIVNGIPSRPVGVRFATADIIKRHENMIRTGRFEFTEKGYDLCHIEPGDP